MTEEKKSRDLFEATWPVPAGTVSPKRYILDLYTSPYWGAKPHMFWGFIGFPVKYQRLVPPSQKRMEEYVL